MMERFRVTDEDGGVRIDKYLTSVCEGLSRSYLQKLLKSGQVLVGFAAETQDLLSNAGKKLREKNADIIAANDLTREGAGFGGDTNILTLLFAGGKTLELPKLSKEAAARRLLTEAAALL